MQQQLQHMKKKKLTKEPFQRISIHALISLILKHADKIKSEAQTAAVDDNVEDEKLLTDGNFKKANNNNTGTEQCSAVAHRSTLIELINGIGEADDWNNKQNSPTHNWNKRHFCQDKRCALKQKTEFAFLLVDVRPESQFFKYRIKGAISFPYTNLCKGFTSEPAEMLAMKNQSGKMIICYDNDERLAKRVATMLVQRDYENVYLLSGGLCQALKLYPNGLIAGCVPSQLGEKAQHLASTLHANFLHEQCTEMFRNCKLRDYFITVEFSSDDLQQLSNQMMENQKAKEKKISICKFVVVDPTIFYPAIFSYSEQNKSLLHKVYAYKKLFSMFVKYGELTESAIKLITSDLHT
ncbi:Centrosomal protein of 41 kDa [Trichinella sp. T8]|nr:Centrosomal protein of 41 kDa [Trichinella sp. T8]